MDNKEYLDKYEASLQTGLQRYLLAINEVDEMLPDAPDIEGAWEDIAKEYLTDGVREFNDYPTVSLGWMMYVGMAVAQLWDIDWEHCQKVGNIYLHLREKRGFDCLDEYIRQDILGLEGDAFTALEKIVGDCSTMALRAIQHERFEPGSPLAFHSYVRTLHQMYLMGSAMQLHRLGYHMTKA